KCQDLALLDEDGKILMIALVDHDGKILMLALVDHFRKTIKALRSDQRGEYFSQEFKDYQKACRFVLQLTPPYTP
ncbi:retrotransposon protein, putative, ty1-copia subclass, partial [Tanacetum coccineum]